MESRFFFPNICTEQCRGATLTCLETFVWRSAEHNGNALKYFGKLVHFFFTNFWNSNSKREKNPQRSDTNNITQKFMATVFKRHTCIYCGRKRIEPLMKALFETNFLQRKKKHWHCNVKLFKEHYDCFQLQLKDTSSIY